MQLLPIVWCECCAAQKSSKILPLDGATHPEAHLGQAYMGLGPARACTVHVVGDMKVAGLQLIALSEPLQLQPLHPFLVPDLRAGEVAEVRHLECHLPMQPSSVTDPYNGSVVNRSTA